MPWQPDVYERGYHAERGWIDRPIEQQWYVQAPVRQAVRQAVSRTGEARAERLLRAHLDRTQLAAWKRGRAFRVVGPSGSVYLIRGGMGSGYVANVELEQIGPRVWREAANVYRRRVGRRLCVGFFYHPEPLPECDLLLAQKLALTTSFASERRFVEMACVG